MAPSDAWKPNWAMVDVAGGGTFRFHPVTVPDSDAKMNVAVALISSALITKSVVELNTCPVGAPPGIVTSRPTFFNALPLTSPLYSVLRSFPLDETQNAPAFGFSEMPQALTKCGSRTRATPGWSDTRSVARYAVGTSRLSSDSRANATRTRRMMTPPGGEASVWNWPPVPGTARGMPV